MSFDLAAVRREFPILSETVHGRPLHYLDNAATSQIPEPVLDAVVRHESHCRANVLRGNHALATMATEAFEAARRELLESMEPLMGGGQMIRSVTWERTTYLDPPRRFEAGTSPIAQAIGLGAACRWLGGIDWEAGRAHAHRLAGRVLDGLAAIAGARVIGPGDLEARAPLVSFTLAGLAVAEICRNLDERHGVAVRDGHHCAMPLMAALGLSDGTARASLAFYNDDGDVDALLVGLADTVSRAA